MGPSGSGKSTLFNMIGALDRPTEGRVYIDGQNMSQLSQKQIAAFGATVSVIFFRVITCYTCGVHTVT